MVFVEKGLSLLNERGRLGFILPHKFFNAQYGEPLRGLIAEGRHLADVVHFGDQQVFAGATTYTCLLFLEKERGSRSTSSEAHDLAAWRQGEPQVEGELSRTAADGTSPSAQQGCSRTANHAGESGSQAFGSTGDVRSLSGRSWQPFEQIDSREVAASIARELRDTICD